MTPTCYREDALVGQSASNPEALDLRVTSVLLAGLALLDRSEKGPQP